MASEQDIEYRLGAAVTDEQLNGLFSESWPNYRRASFRSVLKEGLTYICAFRKEQLVGYVNIAWDGRSHAFVLDPTVHPLCRQQGIGRQLVMRGIAAAKEAGVEWVHVDFEPHLREFYRQCGFQASEAGVINVANWA